MIVPDIEFTTEDIHNVYEKLDLDNTRQITYSQFLIGSLDPVLLQDQRLLELMFNELDTVQEGFVTKESIGIALKRHGIELDSQTIEKVFTRLG